MIVHPYAGVCELRLPELSCGIDRLTRMRKQFFWTVSVRFLNSTELAATLNLSPTTTIKWLLDLAEVRDTAVDWEGWGLEKRGLNFQVSTSWQIPEDFVPLLVTAVTSRKAGETRPQALLRVLSGPEAVQDLAVGSASSVPAQLAVESGPHVRNAQTEFLQAVSEILTEAKDVLNKIEKASEKARSGRHWQHHLRHGHGKPVQRAAVFQ